MLEFISALNTLTWPGACTLIALGFVVASMFTTLFRFSFGVKD